MPRKPGALSTRSAGLANVPEGFLKGMNER